MTDKIPIKDRRVHASNIVSEIVRYDKTGKWYLEYPYKIPRTRISVAEASYEAYDMVLKRKGKVYLEIPGGKTFDRLYKDFINAD